MKHFYKRNDPKMFLTNRISNAYKSLMLVYNIEMDEMVPNVTISSINVED